ncbi:MAG TPA: thioredoxin domain-containing protein [Ignavibacteria bacterium]|nr:thioredoxin domain-containing protein [Ignavibacteria bacterium]
MSNFPPNELIKEKSPYLLQHAYNPVNWYSWNSDALKKSKEENKPIFLSIGYSTCYWCHVMEREVFENPDIAKLMNEYFVNIKVDREERPDIDRIYMLALQSMTGSGGWPMSIFLTPDLKPFYGGTYIPPKAKYGRAGFEDVITQINELWKTKKEEIITSSNEIFKFLENKTKFSASDKEELTDEPARNCYKQAKELFDFENGGFGSGNKFPRTVELDFLINYGILYKDNEAIDIVKYTLQKIYLGGITDHLGGGIHRYAVDTVWRVPHFEKMLYDQGLVMKAYSDIYSICGNKLFLNGALEIAKYVKQNLLSQDGGFYSAEDAENETIKGDKSSKEEGDYYLWTREELIKELGQNDADIFIFYYGVLHNGNTISDPHNVFRNKNVLYIANDLYETSKKFEKSPDEIITIINECKDKLLTVRNTRVKPQLDDKILTSWNAIMTSGFLRLYEVSGVEEFLNIALKNLEFIKSKLYEDGQLYHRYKDGEKKFEAGLEDYAFLIDSNLKAYEITFNISYLDFATELNKITLDKFCDNANGGFFDSEEISSLILRTKEIYDGAEPSGNGVQLLNMIKLHTITQDSEIEIKTEKSLKLFYNELNKSSFSYPVSILALLNYLKQNTEIIYTGADADINEMKNYIMRSFIPFKISIKANDEIEKYSKLINKDSFNFYKPSVYICKDFKCEKPANNLEELKKIII